MPIIATSIGIIAAGPAFPVMRHINATAECSSGALARPMLWFSPSVNTDASRLSVDGSERERHKRRLSAPDSSPERGACAYAAHRAVGVVLVFLSCFRPSQFPTNGRRRVGRLDCSVGICVDFDQPTMKIALTARRSRSTTVSCRDRTTRSGRHGQGNDGRNHRAFGAIFGSMVMEGGNPTSLIAPPALMLIIVGTFGATCAGTSLEARSTR